MPETNAQQPYRPPALPSVNTIAWADVRAAIAAGWEDFRAAPLMGAFFGAVYALGGIAVFLVLRYLGTPWLIIPFAIGFPLLGPFAAVGLYEISRRRERGEPLAWRPILTVVLDQANRQIGWMSLVILFIFWIWIYQVRLLLALFLGLQSFSSLSAFLDVVFYTPEGNLFLLIGTCVGGVLAFILFASTVISMPLLLDRDLDFVTAMIVSFQAVFQNLRPMLGWALLVGGLTVLALLPLFLGLVIVMPVLGHATWHLYRKVIAPAPAQ